MGVVHRREAEQHELRGSLSPTELMTLRAPADWRCSDMEFVLDDLPEPARVRIRAIPTRLTPTRQEIDATTRAACDATRSLLG